MNLEFRRRKGFFGGLSVTTQLIILNVVFYVISLFVLGIYGEKFFLENFALTPSMILAGKNFWTILTSMFTHVLFFHIFANMFSLFFIGTFLEKLIGKKRFLGVYLFAGIVGGIFFVLSGMIFHNDSPGVGASGAIFGLLGVLSVLVPYSKIYLIIGPLILLILDAVSGAFVSAGTAAVLSMIFNILIFAMIFCMLSFNPRMRRFAIPVEMPMWILPLVAIVPLVIIGFFVDLPIGNSAHIGGLFVGVAYGFYLRFKFPRKTQALSRHFSK
jgi:membrane associated rhomboid family serine protease